MIGIIICPRCGSTVHLQRFDHACVCAIFFPVVVVVADGGFLRGPNANGPDVHHAVRHRGVCARLFYWSILSTLRHPARPASAVILCLREIQTV